MTPGDEDPFGRRGEEETDAFGRPIAPEGESAPASGSLWSGQAEQPAPAAPEAPRFRPPTDAPAPPAAFRPPPPPQSMAVPSDLASYGDRAGAAVIDFFVRAAITLVVTLLFAAVSSDAAGAGLLLGLYLISPLYAPILMSRWDGQTIGHRAVSTRIVTRRGEPVTGGKAFVREFLVKGILIEGLGGLFTLGILPLVNYLWPLWDERNEALHDKMCDTRVVNA